MQALMLGIAVFVLLCLLAAVGYVFATLWRSRGTRLVECPENHNTAAVALSAGHALRAGLTGRSELRLSECSRWPAKRECGQECLAQIAGSPEGCLVRHILEEWFADKHCVICGKATGPVRWADRAPALMTSECVTLEWAELIPETIPDLLRTHQPVCFDCHTALTFRRKFPALVVDRH
jgi:hypothetical protein